MGYKVNLENGKVEEELMSKLLELGIQIEMPEDKEEKDENNSLDTDNNNSKDE